MQTGPRSTVTTVRVSRPYDSMYDPIYTVSTSGGRYPMKNTRSTQSPAVPADMPHIAAEHLGATRHKFYKRPDLPGNAEISSGVVLSQPPAKPAEEEVEKLPANRTIAVQTAFRESEAQTEAWSPEFVVDPDDDNEVHSIAFQS